MTEKNRTTEVIAQNPLTSILAAIFASGTLSGVGVDQLFGGDAAREERDQQIGLVVNAAERAARQYEERIEAIKAREQQLLDVNRMIYADLQECHAANRDIAEGGGVDDP